MSQDTYRTGRIVGDRYRLERKIGSGGYGAVWVAREGGSVVALKILHPHLRENVLAVERFSREAEVLERLSHPNVARPIAWGSEGEDVWLALELVEGITLKEEIGARATEARHFPLEEIARLAREMCGALDHAHELGIVHRDLKPANIMLSPVSDDGAGGGGVTTKILDFGIAKITKLPPGDATTVGRLLGSWLYMAPEQVRGENVDHRSDIFALGATMFEMLTLRSAFARDEDGRPMIVDHTPELGHGANNRYNLLKRIVLEARPRPSDSRAGLSPAIDRVVLRAMDFDPKDRFQTAGDLLRAFEQAIDPAYASSQKIPPVNLAIARAPTALPEDLVGPEEGFSEVTAADTGGDTTTALRPQLTEVKSTGKTDVIEPLPDTLIKPRVSVRLGRSGGSRVLFGVLLATIAVVTAAIVVLVVPREEVIEPAPEKPRVEVPVVDPKIQPRVVAEQPREPDPDPEPPEPAKAQPTQKRLPVVQPAQPAQPQPYADLRRMLGEIRANPGDLDRIGRLSDRLLEEAERLPDPAARTSVKRCATTMRAEADEVARCLALLTASLKK